MNISDNNKIRLSMLIVWILALTVTGIFTLKYRENPIRIFIPAIGLALIFIIEKLAKFQFKHQTAILSRRLVAIPFLTLGFSWITLFTLTAYRSHHRPIIIPLGVLFLIIGLTLTHYKVN